MKRVLLIALLAAVPAAACPASAAAQSHSRAGTTSLPLLVLGLGPVGAGLSEALTAWPGGPDAVYWNPAAAANSGFGRTVLLSWGRYFEEVRQTGLAYLTRLGPAGVMVQLYHAGVDGIPVREGPTQEPIGTTAVYDLAGALSVGLALPRGGSAGLTVKALHTRLDFANASGMAVDGGLHLPLPLWEERLQVGLAVRNIGHIGALEQEPLKLPRSFAAGVALAEPLARGPWLWRAGMDVWNPVDDFTQVRLGAEAARDMLRLRAGFRAGRGHRTLSAGVGLVLGGWRFDYAYVYDTDPDRSYLGALQRLGIMLDLDTLLGASHHQQGTIPR